MDIYVTDALIKLENYVHSADNKIGLLVSELVTTEANGQWVSEKKGRRKRKRIIKAGKQDKGG
jgi:hypothetical protein